jgi:nicotinamidase/pyrazinamidase
MVHSCFITLRSTKQDCKCLFLSTYYSNLILADFLEMVNCMNEKYVVKESDALLITDIQNDFLPGGALPVPNGNLIIPVLNQYIKRFEAAKGHVFASRDWHPVNHMSFKKQGGIWPPHCVQQTEGANFSSLLKLPMGTIVISKAIDPKKEAYSAFDGTNLADELSLLGIRRFFVGGVATDYCVVNTVIDACKLGYETIVLMDATLGINVNPGDVDNAFETMKQNGARQVTTDDFADMEDIFPVEKSRADVLAEKPAFRAIVKKKARMRPRGSAKKLPTEK